MTNFFDPLSLLLVAGGSIVVAVTRSTFDDVGGAARALFPLLRARPQADARRAEVMLRRIERRADRKGVATVDRIVTGLPFLDAAEQHLANDMLPEALALWAAGEIAARRSRHEAAQGVWRAIADSAPGMGMIGTVIGLMGMFAAMDDTAKIGPAMALAMLTTLYGAVVSYCIAGPIADRLDRLSMAERDWQSAAARRLEAVARESVNPVKRRITRSDQVRGAA